MQKLQLGLIFAAFVATIAALAWPAVPAGPAVFVFGIVAAGILLVPQGDRLRTLKVSHQGMEAALADFVKVKEEVYATLETARAIAEEMAAASAFTTASVGRFGGAATLERLLATRNRLHRLLNELGTDEENLLRTLLPLNRMILHDVRDDLRMFIVQAARARHPGGENNPEYQALMAKIGPAWAHEKPDVPPEALRAALAAQDLLTPQIEERVAEWETALTQLRKIGADTSF